MHLQMSFHIWMILSIHRGKKGFFTALDARMENYIEDKLDAPIKKLGETAGYLTADMAAQLGLLQ